MNSVVLYVKVKSILYELGATHLHLVFWYLRWASQNVFRHVFRDDANISTLCAELFASALVPNVCPLTRYSYHQLHGSTSAYHQLPTDVKCTVFEQCESMIGSSMGLKCSNALAVIRVLMVRPTIIVAKTASPFPGITV